MHAEMTCATAIARIEQKIGYLQSKLGNCSTDARTAHFAELDIAAFALAIDSLKYLDAVQQYELATKLK